MDTGTVAPGAPQVQVEEAELTVEAGHTATLRCSATGTDGAGTPDRQSRAALGLNRRHERSDDVIIPREGTLLLLASPSDG